MNPIQKRKRSVEDEKLGFDNIRSGNSGPSSEQGEWYVVKRYHMIKLTVVQNQRERDSTTKIMVKVLLIISNIRILKSD